MILSVLFPIPVFRNTSGLLRCYAAFRTSLEVNEDEGIDSHGKNWICCDALYASNLDGRGDKILFHPFVST